MNAETLPLTISEPSEYDKVTKLDWAEYELATIEYDYKIHPNAAQAIRAIFKRLANEQY